MKNLKNEKAKSKIACKQIATKLASNEARRLTQESKQQNKNARWKIPVMLVTKEQVSKQMNCTNMGKQKSMQATYKNMCTKISGKLIRNLQDCFQLRQSKSRKGKGKEQAPKNAINKQTN